MRIPYLKTILILGVFFVGLLTLWFLVAQDTICIDRTGIEPDSAYVSNPTYLKKEVETMRDEVTAALIRQFDQGRGLFVYSMHPNGSISSNNNAIRQLLASRVLAEESMQDETLRDLHKKNLDVLMSEWYKVDPRGGYVYFDNKSKLGANAMLLRVLVASPYFETYQMQATELAKGIEELSDADGSFRAWYVEPDYAYNEDYLLTFYSGEAILALLEYADKTGNETAFKAAKRAQDFYIEKYVAHIDENYYPAYVPWHTQSLARLYHITGDERYAQAIYVMNDKLLELQDRKHFVGRFNNPDLPQYGSPHAASDAVYLEGLSYAYAVAKERGDLSEEDRYLEAIIYGFSYLQGLQYRPGLLFVLDDADAKRKLLGGIMSDSCSRSIRIDTDAHAVDGLTKLAEVLGGG